MKSMVVCLSQLRKMLSFSTTKVDYVDVLCIDPVTEKLTKHPSSRAGFHR